MVATTRKLCPSHHLVMVHPLAQDSADLAFEEGSATTEASEEEVVKAQVDSAVAVAAMVDAVGWGTRTAVLTMRPLGHVDQEGMVITPTLNPYRHVALAVTAIATRTAADRRDHTMEEATTTHDSGDGTEEYGMISPFFAPGKYTDVNSPRQQVITGESSKTPKGKIGSTKPNEDGKIYQTSEDIRQGRLGFITSSFLLAYKILTGCLYYRIAGRYW